MKLMAIFWFNWRWISFCSFGYFASDFTPLNGFDGLRTEQRRKLLVCIYGDE